MNLSIFNHLLELRIRLYYCILYFILSFIVIYYYSEEIIYILSNPLNLASKNLASFIYTDITEVFTTYIKLSFFLSLYFSFPIIVYQLWAFLVPGLYKYEKHNLAIFFILSILFFFIGTLLAYKIILPLACKFFLSFEVIDKNLFFNLHLEAKINEYINLILNILFLFGLSFQFPIYLVLFLKLNLLKLDWLITKRNYFYVIAFIIAALISPPDVFSQILIAIPLILFYEITIFIYLLFQKY